MDFSAHVAAALGFFPFIVAVPAGIAVVCNHIDAAKRHPKVVYTSCGLLSLCIAFLLSRLPGTTFRGVNLGVAGVLAALSFVVAYLRATDILTKSALALLWRELFLVAFAVLCLCFFWGDWKNWSYGLLAALCAASAVLLWRSSPLSKYPLYAATLYLAGGALFGGIYNYLHDPTLLQKPIKFQIIGWLIPGIPSLLLVNCCLYARRIGRADREVVARNDDG
jgi:hypothetical protein